MTFTIHTLIFHTTVRDIIQDNFPGNQHRDGGGGGGGERVGRVMAALSALSVKYFFYLSKKHYCNNVTQLSVQKTQLYYLVNTFYLCRRVLSPRKNNLLWSRRELQLEYALRLRDSYFAADSPGNGRKYLPCGFFFFRRELQVENALRLWDSYFAADSPENGLALHTYICLAILDTLQVCVCVCLSVCLSVALAYCIERGRLIYRVLKVMGARGRGLQGRLRARLQDCISVCVHPSTRTRTRTQSRTYHGRHCLIYKAEKVLYTYIHTYIHTYMQAHASQLERRQRTRKEQVSLFRVGLWAAWSRVNKTKI